MDGKPKRTGRPLQAAPGMALRKGFGAHCGEQPPGLGTVPGNQIGRARGGAGRRDIAGQRPSGAVGDDDHIRVAGMGGSQFAGKGILPPQRAKPVQVQHKRHHRQRAGDPGQEHAGQPGIGRQRRCRHKAQRGRQKRQKPQPAAVTPESAARGDIEVGIARAGRRAGTRHMWGRTHLIWNGFSGR